MWIKNKNKWLAKLWSNARTIYLSSAHTYSVKMNCEKEVDTVNGIKTKKKDK